MALAVVDAPERAAPVASPAMGEVLIHLHVPKCAGSSVNHLLLQQFRGRILMTPGIDTPEAKQFRRLSTAERDQRFDAVTGHIQWGVHLYFSRPTLTFSVIRDPIERICSHFNFVHVQPENGAHKLLKANLRRLDDLTMDLLGKTPWLSRAFRNIYCRTYSGFPVTTETEYRLAEDSVLTAIRSKRLVLGSLSDIERLLHTKGVATQPLPRHNVTDVSSWTDFTPASPATLAPRTRALLEDANRYDLRLLQAIDRLKAEDAA